MDRSAMVGIIANPASARDVRRLVAHGGALTTHDKLNLLHRVLAGLAAVGIDRVISMSDGSGIMSGLLRAAERRSNSSWPDLVFVDQPLTRTAADTSVATRAMVEAGVGSIVVLGGDGTNRVVARESAATPLVSVSTGTNNAFPMKAEPTVAGVAAGLVATDGACRAAGTFRAKTLVVESGDRVEHALVDVAVSSTDAVGSGAVWDASTLRQLFLTFAEADAIGLSAIGGHVQPLSRREPTGLMIDLGAPATQVVTPPIGPGLVQPVEIRSVETLRPGVAVPVGARRGVVALDGERTFRFGPDDRPVVTLREDGPVVVDVAATMRHAAAAGRLAAPAARSTRPTATGGPASTSTETDEKGSHREATQSARPLYRDGQDPAVRVPDLAGVPR